MSKTVTSKPELLILGPPKSSYVNGLEAHFIVHSQQDSSDAAQIDAISSRVRALAVTHAGPKPHERIDAAFMARFPRLEIVASFGVGYDHVDARWAAQNGIVVTNTPDVLNEEVADTALGLILCTVRQLPQATRFLREGRWLEGAFPLSATLRNRTLGVVGMGRIGQAIARRLEAFGVPIAYHSRQPNPAVAYRHYPSLLELARDVDILVVIVPGGAETRRLIDATVLEALGANGILINVGRGSVVDEGALIAALRERRILAAGLDVFENEPHVPAELLGLDNVVLFPHIGSATQYTRGAMEQLVVDNLLAWADGRDALTPVSETRALRNPRRGG